jgi:hypothetical protein
VRSSLGRSVLLALGVTVLAVILLYVASTWGYAAWSQSRAPQESGIAAMPTTVENAPPSVGTTGQYGPLGTVSMVFAGTRVEDGLVGEVEQPWLGIAARTGEYRALTAPDLPSPEPGAVAIDRDGDRLAWATGDGVVVYDTGTGDSRRVPLDGASRVGKFSPDGSMLSVHAGGLSLLDLDSGQVVAETPDTDPEVVRHAAWRADSSAVDHVAGADLVTLPADGSDPTTQPSPFDEGVPLAWAPDGEQLAALQEDDDGVLSLVTAPADPDGALGEARTVDTSGVSLDGLLGFSGDDTVAVSAYLLESGSIERVLDIELDGGSPVDVSALPSPGENWRSSATLAVSDQALLSGSTDFGNKVWPWSYRARLATCALLGLFFLGLWATRRRRTRRRRQRT